MRCDVCYGQKTVRMPVYSRMVAFSEEPDRMPELMQSYRDYPCPECTEQIPYTRLHVVREVSAKEVDSPLNEEAITRILVKQAAHAIIDRAIRDGMVKVERMESVRGHQYRCSVGFVAPKHVATLEERIAERQLEVAAELVIATSEEINNWGSYYHGRNGGSVGKWQALEWLQEALKKVKEKYSASRRKQEG